MRRTTAGAVAVWAIACLAGCAERAAEPPPAAARGAARRPPAGAVSAAAAARSPVGAPASRAARPKRAYKVVHVFVALCDNEHQGIVPVPQALGNGQEPTGNLYWGAMYGAKTFLRRSSRWRTVALRAAGPGDRARRGILDEAAFRLADARPAAYVLAEAYDGARMTAALTDFFDAASGRLTREAGLSESGRRFTVQAGGAADVVCFVGHNGLMDHRLEGFYHRSIRRRAGGPEFAIVLACRSRAYFGEPLRRIGCPLRLGTMGLMAPEAYTLDAALRSWAAGEDAPTMVLRAAGAYAKYQRCSRRAARKLFAAR